MSGHFIWVVVIGVVVLGYFLSMAGHWGAEKELAEARLLLKAFRIREGILRRLKGDAEREEVSPSAPSYG